MVFSNAKFSQVKKDETPRHWFKYWARLWQNIFMYWNLCIKITILGNNEIKRTKRAYLNEELRENFSRPDRLWKTIKEVFPTKSKLRKTPITFKIENEQINDKKLVSERFCNFFSTIATNLKSQAFVLKDFIWGHK